MIVASELVHNDFPPANSTGPRILAYAAGSCPNNQIVSFDNPAGWGFALTLSGSTTQHPPTDATWHQAWGPVKTIPTDIVHPLPGSNNTGELKAIIGLFDYLLYYSPFSETDQLTRGCVAGNTPSAGHRCSKVLYGHTLQISYHSPEGLLSHRDTR